jgi:hypothetical protein
MPVCQIAVSALCARKATRCYRTCCFHAYIARRCGRDACRLAIFTVCSLVLTTSWALGGSSVARRWRNLDAKVSTLWSCSYGGASGRRGTRGFSASATLRCSQRNSFKLSATKGLNESLQATFLSVTCCTASSGCHLCLCLGSCRVALLRSPILFGFLLICLCFSFRFPPCVASTGYNVYNCFPLHEICVVHIR